MLPDKYDTDPRPTRQESHDHFHPGRVLVDAAEATQAIDVLEDLLADPARERETAGSARRAVLQCLELAPGVIPQQALERLRERNLIGGKDRILQAMEADIFESTPRTIPMAVARPRATDEKLARRTDDVGSGVTIGIIDSLPTGPWLAGSWLTLPSWVNTGDSPWTPFSSPPTAAHGSFVAGLILQGAPGATLKVFPVLDEDQMSDACRVAEAITRLVGDVDILNISLGCYTQDDEKPFALERAFRAVRETETVVVAAAGNPGNQDGGKLRRRPVWPAALSDAYRDQLAAVGAAGKIDGEWHVADFSPDGDWITAWAPGVDVLSTFTTFSGFLPSGRFGAFSGWARWSGTSFAAALVTGAVARELADLRNAGKAASPADALAAVLATADRVRDRDEPLILRPYFP